MDRSSVKRALRWLEVSLHIVVPLAATVVVFLQTITPERFSQLTLLQILLALVAAIAVSEALLRYGSLNEIESQVSELSEKSNLQLLRSAHEAGIVSVCPRATSEWLSDITLEITKANGPLDLCGIGLPKFRSNDALRKALVDHAHRHDVRVLLLDPTSDEATRRADIEKPLGRTTLADIQGTIEWLQLEQAQNRRFRIHLYTLPPMMALVITDLFAFVETYHFGRPEGLEGCIGGHVPMLKLSNNPALEKGNSYRFFKAHFNYLWKFTHGLRVNLPIRIVDAVGASFLVMENGSDMDILMNEWELSGQRRETPFRFPAGFTWKSGQKVVLATETDNMPEADHAFHTSVGLLERGSTILTLTNGVGTVVCEWAVGPERDPGPDDEA